MIMNAEFFFMIATLVAADGMWLSPVGGDTKSTKKDDWGVSNLYDGQTSTKMGDNQCYHSGGWDDPWVEVYLETYSEINRISVLNRGDCCAQRAEGIRVKVCKGAGGSYCQLCGIIIDTPSGDWIDVYCSSRLYGDSVRLEHNHFIHLCEIRIEGAPVQTVRGNRIIPVSGDAKDANRPEWNFTRLYDGLTSTSISSNQCYHSGSSSGAWVEVHLPFHSTINSVAALNRGDCCEWKALGMQVKVCDKAHLRTHCQLCGVILSAPSGDWINVKCPSGITGDTIRFEHNEYIHLCELYIEGVPTESVDRIIPSGGDMKDAWKAEWDFTKIYDGLTSTNFGDNECYHSRSATGAWVEALLPTAHEIQSVSILTRDCCVEKLVGLHVKVCDLDGSDCRLCGQVNSEYTDAWITLDCAPTPGDKHTVIRFEHNQTIQICEVYIRANLRINW